MKTKLFSALLLGAAIAFAGCEKPDDPNNPPIGPGNEDAVESITVTPSEVILEIGGSIRLSYTLSPAGAAGTVVWSSEDPTIATVTEKGYVEAVGYGTVNITATCGKHSASCAVTIKSYLETLDFTGATYMDVDTLAYGGEVHTIQSLDGESFNAYLAAVNIWLMSDGFTINNSGDLDGGTTVSYIDLVAPVFYSPASINPGATGNTIFVLGDYSIHDMLGVQVAANGSIDEAKYMQYLSQFASTWNEGVAANDENKRSSAFAYLDQAAEQAISGAQLITMTYHTTAEGYNQDGYYSPYIPDAIASTNGVFYLSGNPSNRYMLVVDYLDVICKPLSDDQYTWGCNWDENPETGIITWVDQALHFGKDLHYAHGTVPAKSPKLIPVQAPILSIDCPEVYKHIKSQIHQNTESMRMKR